LRGKVKLVAIVVCGGLNYRARGYTSHMLNAKIQEYLASLDQDVSPLLSFHGENKIADRIKDIIKAEGQTYAPADEDVAERIAFDFLAEYPDVDSGWGTYYGPIYVLPNGSGQMVEYPSIQGVTETTLTYWTVRAFAVKNPLLSSRYADLVVDFSPKVFNKTADYKLIQLVIDANIEICAKKLAAPLDCKIKLKRTLLLSLQISDKERIARVKDTIIALESTIAEDDKAGLWGFAFNWLVLEYSQKVLTTSEEIVRLLNDLEKRLERVKANPWSAEHAVSLLAEYYAREKDEDNLMRVLGVLEAAHKGNAPDGADALLRVHAFEQIQEVYRKYQDKGFPKAKSAFDRIVQEIGSLNLDWKKSLKKVSVTTEIKKDEIDKFLAAIFGKESPSSLETVVARIALNFLPKQADIKTQLDETSRRHPISFLFTTQVISGDGIPVAKLSSLKDDYPQHLQRHATQYVQLNAIFLSLTIDELKKRFSKEVVIKYFDQVAVLQNEDKEYLHRALTAYWDGDYLVASHFFIPLIESSIRELIRLCGGIILKPNNISGYDRLTLTQLLYSQGDIVQGVFSQLGEDMLFYLRLVLIEKLGMNLRNNFAHGLEKRTFFSREASDRLFHVLSCMSFIKKRD